MKPVRTFNVTPWLPQALAALREINYNLGWTWHHDAIELFRWDNDLWEASRNNPVLMLGTEDQTSLEAAANDEGFLTRLNRVASDFDAYLKSESTWFRRQHGKVDRPLIAYFSAEFGLADCLAVFAGGLGILAGDHLKSASDLGVPLVGVGLLYQQGYFRQYLNEAGLQQEAYEDNDFHNLPLILERRADLSPLIIEVAYPGRVVYAQIWRAQVGRVALYLLDTNIAANPRREDQDITDQLYGGDNEMRIAQEIMLGIGGWRALEALGIEPAVCHLNEGHSAFLALERARCLMEKHNLNFAEAREAASAGLIFTTHTPVAAGHDYFPPGLMQRYFGEYAGKIGLSFREFMALGRKDQNNDDEMFCMTVLALRMARSSNGVSRLHGQVSRRMWQSLWSEVPEVEVPIGHISNGVHFQSWISREMDELYDRHLGPRWHQEPADQSLWMKINRVSPEELWRTHERRRERLVAFARRRLRAQLERRGAPQAEIEATDEALDPDILTICFARRFATYKRATLILRDTERLARILNNPERPMQIIFSGRAHPRDDEGKELIRQVVSLCRNPEFRNRIVFLENYDMAVTRSMTQGADVWLNTPRRPMEASGTSGMKAAANGVLNLSTLDGWWDEAWDCGLRIADRGLPESECFSNRWPLNVVAQPGISQSAIRNPQSAIGWAIGRGETYDNPDYQDQVEAEMLYELLERDVVPTFYDRGPDKLPRRWIARMKDSIGNLCFYFNSHRMAREYTERFYLPAAHHYEQLVADEAASAKKLAAWKAIVRENWAQIRIESVDADSVRQLQVGEQVKVRARVYLGRLSPDDVAVELYAGLINGSGDLVQAEVIPMKPVESVGDGKFVFESDLAPRKSGLHGCTVRMLPRHADLSAKFLPGMIVWAGTGIGAAAG